RGVVRRGVHEPHALDVRRAHRASRPRDAPLGDERLELGAHLGRDEVHERPVGEEHAHAASGDRAATHDEHLAPREVDTEQGRHGPPPLAASLGSTTPTCTTPTSTTPSSTRTGQVRRSAEPPVTGTPPTGSRHAPVSRSNTCLYIGEAIVGRTRPSTSREPTMPREITCAPENGSSCLTASTRSS